MLWATFHGFNKWKEATVDGLIGGHTDRSTNADRRIGNLLFRTFVHMYSYKYWH